MGLRILPNINQKWLHDNTRHGSSPRAQLVGFDYSARYMSARESAGGIVVGLDGRVVVVHQWGATWSFPKGGVEHGESHLDAARREIWEETGISDLELHAELGSYERYSMGRDHGELVHVGMRKRTFYLFSTRATDLVPQEHEVTDARFVTLDQAMELLTHHKDKEFLSHVRAAVEDLAKKRTTQDF